MIEKLISVARGTIRKEKEEENKQVSNIDDFLIKGLGASFGVVVGSVKVVNKSSLEGINKRTYC